MSSPMKLLNRLLPFATPGTPLIQDTIHLAVLCVLLYFAPQIQQRIEKWRARNANEEAEIQYAFPRGDEQLDQHVPERHDMPQENLAERHDDLNHEDAVPLNEPQEDLANFDDAIENGRPGPATPPPSRNVGAKKAKSLARKDQKRAYNEFMRSQGDAQRARDSEGATEREAALIAERQRRALVEKDLQSRKAQERQAKKDRDEQITMEVAQRTELVLEMVQAELEARRMCDLFKVAEAVGDDVDEEWIERVLKASGMIGKTGNAVTMITETGWIVKVTSENVEAVFQAAVTDDIGDDGGRITYAEIADLLQGVLERSAE